MKTKNLSYNHFLLLKLLKTNAPLCLTLLNCYKENTVSLFSDTLTRKQKNTSQSWEKKPHPKTN